VLSTRGPEGVGAAVAPAPGMFAPESGRSEAVAGVGPGDEAAGVRGGDVAAGVRGGDVAAGVEGGDVAAGVVGGDVDAGVGGGEVAAAVGETVSTGEFVSFADGAIKETRLPIISVRGSFGCSGNSVRRRTLLPSTTLASARLRKVLPTEERPNTNSTIIPSSMANASL